MLTITGTLMGSNSNPIAAYFILLITSWLTSRWMETHGFAHPDNHAWQLISLSRWALTSVGVLAFLIWAIPEIIKVCHETEQRRKTELERLIDNEVKSRLRIIREDDRKNLEREREHRERVFNSERERLEREWLKEFKLKHETDIKKARSATDAVEKAFNEFI